MKPLVKQALLPLFLAVILVATGFAPVFGVDSQPADEKNSGSWVAHQADRILGTIADIFQKRMVHLAERLRQGKHLNLEIKNQFYDKRLRRVFTEFRGTGVFSGKLPIPVKHGDYYITSDGAISYDLTIENLKKEGGSLTFSFQGDLVLSLDQVVYELAKNTVQLGGAVAINAAADELLEFLKGFDLDLLATAITKTLAKFSRETLSVSSAELVDNAIHVNNMKMADLVRASVKSGGMPTFLALTIIKSAAMAGASVVGTSLGATVGNILAPGAGGVVGAFIGSKMFSKGIKVVIYEVTVDIPIDIHLKKIVKYQEALERVPGDEIAQGKLEASFQFIFSRIKREVDNANYHTFDKVLEKIEKFSAGERKDFVNLLLKVQELLRFRLMEKGDWYCAKKMHQLKQKAADWGLTKAFPY